eukprot:SAG31_NODE_4917_length_2868_cov_2.969664_1_plen_261_part_00
MYRPALGPAWLERTKRRTIKTIADERMSQTGVELEELAADCALLDRLAAGDVSKVNTFSRATILCSCVWKSGWLVAAPQTDPSMATLLGRIATQANDAIAAGQEQAMEARAWLSSEQGLVGLAELISWQAPPKEEQDVLFALHRLLGDASPPPSGAKHSGWGEVIENEYAANVFAKESQRDSLLNFHAGRLLADASALPGRMAAAEAEFDGGSATPLIDQGAGFETLNARSDQAKAILVFSYKHESWHPYIFNSEHGKSA